MDRALWSHKTPRHPAPQGGDAWGPWARPTGPPRNPVWASQMRGTRRRPTRMRLTPCPAAVVGPPGASLARNTASTGAKMMAEGGGVAVRPFRTSSNILLSGTITSHPNRSCGLSCAASAAPASCPTRICASTSTPTRPATPSSSGACSAATAPVAGPHSRCGGGTGAGRDAAWEKAPKEWWWRAPSCPVCRPRVSFCRLHTTESHHVLDLPNHQHTWQVAGKLL